MHLEWKTSQFKFGNDFLTWSDATVQGGQLSPSQCLAVCCWLEWHLPTYYKKCLGFRMSMLHLRWMDDIFVAVCLACPRKNVVDYEELDRAFDICFDRVFNVYLSLFSMKLEDASTFIGYDVVRNDDQTITVSPSSFLTLNPVKLSRVRQQHFWSGIPQRMKISLIVGTMTRFIDMSSTEEVATMALTRMIVELMIVEYRESVIVKAIHKMKQRHGYLEQIFLKAQCPAVQVAKLRSLNWTQCIGI